MAKTPWSAEAPTSSKKLPNKDSAPKGKRPAAAKGRTTIDPELQVMLGDIELIDGRPQLSEANFDQWERRLSATPKAEDRLEKAAQLLALAKYFEAKGGPAAVRCIAQLLTFATFLRGEPVGPDEPRAKPSRAEGKKPKAGAPPKGDAAKAAPKPRASAPKPRASVPKPRPSVRGEAKRAPKK